MRVVALFATLATCASGTAVGAHDVEAPCPSSPAAQCGSPPQVFYHPQVFYEEEEVPVPYEVVQRVEKPYLRITREEVAVPLEVIERHEKAVPVVRVVDVPVPYEVVQHIEKPYAVTTIKEVPVAYDVIEKVTVPCPVKKIVEVPTPREQISHVEKKIPVRKEVIVEVPETQIVKKYKVVKRVVECPLTVDFDTDMSAHFIISSQRDAVFKRAAAQRKPVMVIVTEPDCCACRILKESVNNGKRVRKLLSQFHVVHAVGPGSEWQKEYDHGYVPQTYWLSWDGKPLDVTGPNPQHKRFFQKDDVLADAMQKALKVAAGFL
jgi:hypothetical protein